jgi:hypothetical protein
MVDPDDYVDPCPECGSHDPHEPADPNCERCADVRAEELVEVYSS